MSVDLHRFSLTLLRDSSHEAPLQDVNKLVADPGGFREGTGFGSRGAVRSGEGVLGILANIWENSMRIKTMAEDESAKHKLII